MITSGFSQQLFSEAELCCPPEGLKWALYTKYSPIVVTVSLYPKCQPNHRRQGCRDKGAKNGCKDLIYAKTGLLCLEVSWRQVSAPHSPFFAFWVADSGSWNGTSLGSPSSRDSTLRLRFWDLPVNWAWVFSWEGWGPDLELHSQSSVLGQVLLGLRLYA